LKKKIAGQCPCGYFFETLSSENEAVAIIQSHVESFHKNFFPFGITNDEALTLLKIEHKEGKQKASPGTFYSTKTEGIYSSKNTNSEAREKTKRKNQLVENSFS
jgi:hypothetical protein